MTQPNIPNIAARRRQSFFAIRFADEAGTKSRKLSRLPAQIDRNFSYEGRAGGAPMRF
jgi:hypothetical protein